MGKSSKKYPEYSTGSITINGNKVATTTKDKDNNVINTSYNMSDSEKQIYNSIQSGLNTSLKNLFTISDAQRKEWDSQIDAIKEQGIDEINSIYTPMETNLKNDIASRFGNFDNSIFLDNLNEITDKKSKAVADLSNDLLSVQNDLYSNELQNRINTITLLNNLNSVMNNNILNYANAANSNSNSGNTYNNNAYTATANSANSLFGNLLDTGSTILSFIS